MHVALGQTHLAEAQIFVGVQLHFLEYLHNGTDPQLAQRHFHAAFRLFFFQLVQNVQAHVHIRVGIIVHVHGADKGLAGVVVQLLHLILPGLVHINGVFVQQHGNGETVHFANDPVMGRIGNVDDDEVLRRSAAQGNFPRRKFFFHPVIFAVEMTQNVVFYQIFQTFFRVRQTAETLAVPEGQLVSGAFQMGK